MTKVRTRFSLLTSTVLAVAIPLSGATLALHNRLAKSVPAAEAEVESPSEIRLWFTEKVDSKFSSITVAKSDSTKVDASKARGTDDPKSIAVDLTGTLSAGRYQVTWRTAGDDGHAVRGTFKFSVK